MPDSGGVTGAVEMIAARAVTAVQIVRLFGILACPVGSAPLYANIIYNMHPVRHSIPVLSGALAV